MPQHIAIIMDGNRRWARERKLPVIEGHRRVADEILEPLVEYAAKQDISYLTFWAWSTENWKRDENEVRGIMSLFRHVIRKRWKRLSEKGVRIRVIGDTSKFPKDIKKALEDVVEETKENTRITTVFALNYGGRDEIRRAIKKASECQGVRVSREKNVYSVFDTFLDTAGIPDPDMIVRTGGEKRLSGFLLWQSEYSELYFPLWYMPDFTPGKLDEVIAEFNKRQRRFGK